MRSTESLWNSGPLAVIKPSAAGPARCVEIKWKVWRGKPAVNSLWLLLFQWFWWWNSTEIHFKDFLKSSFCAHLVNVDIGTFSSLSKGHLKKRNYQKRCQLILLSVRAARWVIQLNQMTFFSTKLCWCDMMWREPSDGGMDIARFEFLGRS